MADKVVRILLLYAVTASNRTLSYQRGWPDHLRCHPKFKCTPVNILYPGLISRIGRRLLPRLGNFDAVVLSHSVFSNQRYLKGGLYERIRRLPQPKAYFIGNEYKSMPDKMAFAEELGISLLVTQSEDPEVQSLYRQRLGCDVVGIPAGGLDIALFSPGPDNEERSIDLGYRANDGPTFLGHSERAVIAEYFTANAARYGLKTDISMDPSDRFAPPEWAAFLQSCKGQLGTEAGGDYFDLEDSALTAVNQYVQSHPDASVQEVQNNVFIDRVATPLRIFSGRNAEAAGTKTVQILVEGHYSGYFEPDVHYIPLKKDFSNADETVAKFRDPVLCRDLTENAYEVVTRELTYKRLIDRFYEAVVGVL